MNLAIFNYFYSFAHRSAALDALFVFLASDLVWLVCIAVFFYLLKNGDKRMVFRDIAVVFGAALAGAVASTIFKNIFHTLRPFVELTNIQPLVPESGFAFPSGHTTDLMAVAAALWGNHKRASVFVGSAVLIVGFARIIVGVHWPVDILGGILLGSVVGLGTYYLAGHLLQNTQKSLY